MIHRRDLHAIFADGSTDDAEVVIAADGLHSVACQAFIGDEPASSTYVAYRAAVPFSDVRGNDIDDDVVVVYVGPRRHFVQHPLRGGEMFNQVAVFQSPRAVAGETERGTSDELDRAFEGSCDAIQQGLVHMWRDRWWRMFDREPTMNWVFRRVVLLGDSAHRPLQYMAQGAITVIEDGWVLAEHAGSQQAERTTLLRARDVHDYAFTDWIYGPTALTPDQEPPMYQAISLASVGTSPN